MSGYHVCCNQYKNSFFNEFSHLQHEEEFVDLTLAADGYLVKVHKNVIAVASPYLKEMLKSAASHSPVIFLNKVNHVILKYIIEYIYQGEVNVPVGLLNDFVDVAKSLHINGITNVDPKQLPKSERKNIVEPVNNRPINKIAAHIKINNVNNSHSLEIQKCNELETINIDADLNDGIEELETTEYIDDNLEDPPEKQHIDTVTLSTHNNEGKNNNSKCSWSKNGSSLQTSMKNAVDNTESILIQNVEHKGKKLEIVIDATNATLNITRPNLNDTVNTEDIAENTCIGTLNGINHLENEIKDHTFKEDIINNVALEDKIIVEKDGMGDDNSISATSIQVQPLTEPVTHFDSLDNIELDKVDVDELRGMAQYTITQRGSRQLILNRYMYCCQFESRRGLRTRWRCIDYRRSRCPAMIDMENDKILKRTGAHGHGFHDKKIYKKHRKGLIFNTLQIAKEAYIDNPTQFVD